VELFIGVRNTAQQEGTRRMAINTIIHTNEHSVDRVLKAGLPVVIILWWGDTWDASADRWLNDLASEYAGRALIAKVDGAQERALAQRYEANRQTLYVLVNRQGGVTKLRGNQQERDIRAWLTFLVEGGRQPAMDSGRTDSQPQPVHLNDKNFQEIVSGSKPVLVDFWAEWCGPCRAVAPVIDHLAKEFAGRAIVAKLNVDENPRTASAYQIMSIPAIYIFRNGQVVDRLVGAQPLEALRHRLKLFAG
jgi:thioredoxin 1